MREGLGVCVGGAHLIVCVCLCLSVCVCVCVFLPIPCKKRCIDVVYFVCIQHNGPSRGANEALHQRVVIPNG